MMIDETENVLEMVRRVLGTDADREPDLFSDRLNDLSVAMWELDNLPPAANRSLVADNSHDHAWVAWDAWGHWNWNPHNNESVLLVCNVPACVAVQAKRRLGYWDAAEWGDRPSKEGAA